MFSSCDLGIGSATDTTFVASILLQMTTVVACHLLVSIHYH